MMNFVNILKHGKLHGKYVVFECPDCGCKFRESAKRTFDCNTIKGSYFRTVCPECGRYVWKTDPDI